MKSYPSMSGTIGILTCPGFWLSMYCYVTLIRSQAIKMRQPVRPTLVQPLLSHKAYLTKQVLSVLDPNLCLELT